MSDRPDSRKGRRLLWAAGAILILAALTLLLAYPAIERSAVQGRASEALNNLRQVQLALDAMRADKTAGGGQPFRYPADADAKSTREFLRPLIDDNYLSEADYERIVAGSGVLVVNVSESDPPDTPWLVTFLEDRDLEKGFVVFRKNGDGEMYHRESDWDAVNWPDREPQVLPAE